MMSPQSSNRYHPGLRFALAAAMLAAMPMLHEVRAHSQAPLPATSPAIQQQPPASRLDLYGGYGYFHPINSDINNIEYLPINPGAVTSIAGYFTRNLGVQAESSFFPNGPDDCVYTAQAGPIFRIQRGRFVPFAHALIGGAKVGGPVFQPCTWGLGITAGIGFDYILHGFGNHLAIRPIQADYEYSRVNYGPLVTPADVSGGLGLIEAYRLSAGIVLRFGDMNPKVPIALTCSVQPPTSFAGDPLLVTAVASNIEAKKAAAYTWKTTGGTVDAHAETAAISTKGTQPGAYTVMGHVTQGPKPYQSADCSATYTIRDFDPPTVTCTANPASVMAGDPSTITSIGLSPQSRPLTYSYSADAGQIAGNTGTAILNTAGTSAGTIQITCNVVDDLGKSATASTSVMVSVPAPVSAPVPQPVGLCSVTFDRDPKRPSRVNNEAKACLDDIALTLQHQFDARLVLVGNQKPDEAGNIAARRAINVKQYLVDEKGIDAARIEVRTGNAGKADVDSSLIPSGATFVPLETNPVDMGTISLDPKRTKPVKH